jgi:hypothetical protein
VPSDARPFFPIHGHTAALLILALMALVALLLIGWLWLALRVRRLGRQVQALTRGVEGENLAGVLHAHLDTVAQTVRRMEALEQAVAVLQAQLPSCLRQANLIRYDAFEDVGGEQSFSLALLDAHGDGVVLTSVYSRMDVRVYAKAIHNGQASHALSKEEERALREVAAR